MSLPAISAPGIDVDAARLKQVDREFEEAPKSVNVAQPLFAGIQTGEALNEVIAKSDERQKTSMMQQLLDKGWEGYTEVWRAAGAPPKAAPDLLKSLGEKPLTGYTLLAEEQKKAKIEGATTKFTELQSKGVLGDDGVTYRPATQAELDAAELELGGASGEAAKTASGIQTRNSGERKAAAANTVRKEIAEAKNTLATTQGLLNRTSREKIAAMVKKGTVTQSFLNQYDADAKELADLNAEVAAYEALSAEEKLEKSISDPSWITDKRTRSRELSRRVSAAGYKLPDEPAAPATGGSGGKKGVYDPATKTIKY